MHQRMAVLLVQALTISCAASSAEPTSSSGARPVAPDQRKPAEAGKGRSVPLKITRRDQQAMISLTGIDDRQTTRSEYYLEDGTRLFPDLPIYEGRDFVDGLAHVKLLVPGKPASTLQSCLIDTTGKVVLELPGHLWPMVLADRLVSEGLMVVYDMRQNTFGYMDLQGRLVIPARYLEAQPFAQGEARVKTAEGYRTIKHPAPPGQ